MTADFKSLFTKNARSSEAIPSYFKEDDFPFTYNFDWGFGAEELTPVDDLLRLAEATLRKQGPSLLQYGDMYTSYEEPLYGYKPLRELLAQRLNKRDGLNIDRKSVILTAGCIQAIALAINTFIGPGDVLLVEAPTYPYSLKFAEQAGGHLAAVPVDEEGMDMEALERRLHELKKEGLRPKMVYTVATFGFPIGVCMSLARRKRLLELAREWNLLIFEDNVYGEMRYEGENLPTLLSMDDSGLVMQGDSFSKTVVAGVRVGWLVARTEALPGVAAIKQDFAPSMWMSKIMAEYMNEGKMDPLLDKARALYRIKRDTAVAAVREHCGPWVKFRVPDGAFYLWLEIDSRVDPERVIKLARDEGVACHPGEHFFGREMRGAGKQFLRLAYSHVRVPEMNRGIAVLGRAISQSMRA